MLLALPFFLLCACAGNAPQTGETVRAHFSDMTAATATVKILSDIGDSALEYQAEYRYNKDGEDALILTAPEEVAGIEIYIAGDRSDDLTVRYADTELFLALDDPPGVRPVDAPSALLRTLATEEPCEIGSDTVGGVDARFLRYDEADSDPAISRSIWLDEAGNPLCAEIYRDNVKTVTLFFTDFTSGT